MTHGFGCFSQAEATLALADQTIPSGTYAQLCMIVEAATVTLAEGYTFNDGSTERDLFVPSGAQTGIKLSDHSCRRRRRAAIVVSGGQYASDVLQGLPGEDFVSIGFRLTKRRERPVPQRVSTPFVYRAEAVRDRGIALDVPGASRVEIAGDFNGWQPEPLRRDGSGRWVVPGGLEPGVYRFNLRVDGERWMVPDGVPSVDDSFGDRVGLLIIAEE